MEEIDSPLRQTFLQEEICKFLTFEEALKFINTLKVKTLNCPIRVTGPRSNRSIILPGVNEVTIRIYKLIQKHGIDGVLIERIIQEDLEAVQILIKAGVKINVVNGLNQSPLCLAVKHKQYEMVKLLIEAGADLNQTDYQGFTPLMTAYQYEQPQIMELLLKAGADINAVEKNSWSTLTLAVFNNDYPMVKFLLEKGADPNIPSWDGTTALGYATPNNYLEVAKLLREHGGQ